MQQLGFEAALLLDLLLKGGNISLDHISFVACSYSRALHVPLHCISVLCEC